MDVLTIHFPAVSWPYIPRLLEICGPVCDDSTLVYGDNVGDIDPDMLEFLHQELTTMHTEEMELMQAIMQPAASSGRVVIPINLLENVARACTTLRFRIRMRYMSHLSDEDLANADIVVQPDLAPYYFWFGFLAYLQGLAVKVLTDGLPDGESAQGL